MESTLRMTVPELVSVERKHCHNAAQMSELETIFNDLVRLETELWNAVDARLRAELDLPLNRFEPMRVINAHGQCRVLDIATELSIGVSGTSKLVDRIAVAGHCRRLPNPVDGRSSMVELTAEGTALLERAQLIFGDELDGRLGPVLDRADRAHFAQALKRLRAHRSVAG